MDTPDIVYCQVWRSFMTVDANSLPLSTGGRLSGSFFGDKKVAFLKRLFGASTPDVSYYDAVRSLAETLSREVPLPEWSTGIPDRYNDLEQAAVQRIKADFIEEMDEFARRKGGTHSEFHPMIQEELDKLLPEIALRKAASDSIQEQEDFAENWQQAVSTYLKAWLAHSNPFILLDIAQTLKAAGRTPLARLAINATVPFAKFATGKNDTNYPMAAMFIRGAFPGQYPYGDFIEEHVATSGVFSQTKLQQLRQRAASI